MEEPRSQRDRNSLRRALNPHAVFPLGTFTELQWHKTTKTGRKRTELLNILLDLKCKNWNLGLSRQTRLEVRYREVSQALESAH